MTEFLVEGQLDLVVVRKHLNELKFMQGVRRLGVGVVPDLFVDQSPAEIATGIQRIRQQLADHDLMLEQSSDDPPQLFVVQQLTHRPTDADSMARAMQWVSRITTVALEMVVPVVLGTWLDNRLDTNFLVVAGLLIGVPLGLWHLIQLTKV